jgi:ADP-ribose pyrophosphatase
MPEILPKEVQVLSPWAELHTHRIIPPGETGVQEYHGFKVKDYISILALTENSEVILVWQYRPVLERISLELPGGLLEVGEDPAEAILRELHEETGYEARNPVLLGNLTPDSGRMQNRLWCFFVSGARQTTDPAWKEEADVKTELVTLEQLKERIDKGELDHAPHLAIIGLALSRGLIRWDIQDR